jgi:hypothetical protein
MTGPEDLPLVFRAAFAIFANFANFDGFNTLVLKQDERGDTFDPRHGSRHRSTGARRRGDGDGGKAVARSSAIQVKTAMKQEATDVTPPRCPSRRGLVEHLLRTPKTPQTRR